MSGNKLFCRVLVQWNKVYKTASLRTAAGQNEYNIWKYVHWAVSDTWKISFPDLTK